MHNRSNLTQLLDFIFKLLNVVVNFFFKSFITNIERLFTQMSHRQVQNTCWKTAKPTNTYMEEQ